MRAMVISVSLVVGARAQVEVVVELIELGDDEVASEVTFCFQKCITACTPESTRSGVKALNLACQSGSLFVGLLPTLLKDGVLGSVAVHVRSVPRYRRAAQEHFLSY